MKKASSLLLPIILLSVAPFGMLDGYAQQTVPAVGITQVHGQEIAILPAPSLNESINEIFPNAEETIYQSSSVPLIFQYISTSKDGLAVAIKASLYVQGNTNAPVAEVQNTKYLYENTNFNILSNDIVTIPLPSLLPGTYTVQYTIQHQDGTSAVIHGYNNFTIPSGPSSVIETSTYTISPQVIQTFSALLNQSPFGNIAQIFWNFGDNTTGTGSLVQHQYTGTGSYLVQVNLTDNKNYNASGTVPVQVEDANTNNNAPFIPAVLSNTNATIDTDTQLPMITFSPDPQTQNEISKGHLHMYWYRHVATTLESLPSVPYALIAQNNTPSYRDGLNTTAHEYLQYQIRIQDENGYIIGSSETNTLLYDTTPYVPRFTKSYFQNGIATLRYVDQDNDSGHINYKLLKAPEGYTIVNGNLQENLNTNSSIITEVVDCGNPDPTLVVQTGQTKLLQNHEIAGIYLNAPVKADYFLCAQSEDIGGKGSPWPVVSLVQKHTSNIGMPFPIGGETSSGDNSDWGNPIIIALAPSVTSSGGGVNNIAPDPPVLQDPKDGVSVPTITTLQAKYTDFNADNGFVFFRISKDIDCTNATIEGKGTFVKSGEISSWTIPEQLSQGSYYWCAKATDAYNADSIWSESWKFSVNQTEPIVTNINENQNTNIALLPPIAMVKTPPATGTVIGEFAQIPGNTVNNTSWGTSQQPHPTSSKTFFPKQKTPPTSGNGAAVFSASSQTKADNDNDNATNFDETFIYGTSANDASSVPDPLSHDVHISNLQDKDILTTQYPFIVGTATADNKVSIIIADSSKKQTTIGETYADSEGKFALTSSLPLENGSYMLYAKVYDQKNTLIASSEGVLRITVNTSLGLGAPTITSLDNILTSGEQAVITTSPKPMVQGTYQGIEGSQNTIIAVWQSIVTSSQATIDPLHKTFIASPEEPLALGKHMLTLYIQQEKNGQRMIGNTSHLSFEIQENTSPATATTAQENNIPMATQTGVSPTTSSQAINPPSSHPLAASLLTSQESHDSSDWVTTFFGILSLMAAGYLLWSYIPRRKSYRLG